MKRLGIPVSLIVILLGLILFGLGDSVISIADKSISTREVTSGGSEAMVIMETQKLKGTNPQKGIETYITAISTPSDKEATKP